LRGGALPPKQSPHQTGDCFAKNARNDGTLWSIGIKFVVC
jgi:hypothetical protein